LGGRIAISDRAGAEDIGTRLRTEFIKSMGKHNDKFIIVLDIDEVFSHDELGLVEALVTDV